MSLAARADLAWPRPILRLLVVVTYATAMGWLEAVIVVYLRALVGIPRGVGLPPATEILRRIHQIAWLLPAEQTREVATLVMLATVAILAARRWSERFGAFLVCFGVWDIVYYIGLYALLRWPESLATMDLLFLVPPHPWWHQPLRSSLGPWPSATRCTSACCPPE